MDETQRERGGAAGLVATIDESSARVLLEAARDRARGVRETADAINAKLSWVLAYVGVLLVAVVQDWTGLHDHVALRVLATSTLAMLALTVGVAGWAMRMQSLHGPVGASWCSEERAVMPAATVMLEMAQMYLKAAETDRGRHHGDTAGAPRGALGEMQWRFTIVKVSTALVTAMACAFFVAKVWLA